MTAEIINLASRDPVFALAPELKLHLSKLAGTRSANCLMRHVRHDLGVVNVNVNDGAPR